MYRYRYNSKTDWYICTGMCGTATLNSGIDILPGNHRRGLVVFIRWVPVGTGAVHNKLACSLE